MTAASQSGSDDELGPVDFLAVEFPGGQLTAPGFEQLLSLADQGVIDILDMEFIAKDADGTSKKVDVWEFAAPEGVDLSVWAGATYGGGGAGAAAVLAWSCAAHRACCRRCIRP